MRIETNLSGILLIREPGDARISHESTVTHHIRRLLNERDGRRTDDRKRGTWRRFYPDRVGLTGCRQGVWNGIDDEDRGGVAYWHERYAIENAAEEFNKAGRVFYQRVR